MTWAGAVTTYADPFGSLTSGYQQGLRDRIDSELKTVQIAERRQRMELNDSAEARAATNFAQSQADRNILHGPTMAAKLKELEYTGKRLDQSYRLNEEKLKNSATTEQYNRLRIEGQRQLNEYNHERTNLTRQRMKNESSLGSSLPSRDVIGSGVSSSPLPGPSDTLVPAVKPKSPLPMPPDEIPANPDNFGALSNPFDDEAESKVALVETYDTSPFEDEDTMGGYVG